jgi:hypothetical protein
MSSDLTIDSVYDRYNDFILAPPLNYSDWNGHQITWRDLPEIRSEIERRIIGIYNSGNHLLAYQLANLYFEQIHPRYEIQLVKSSKPNIFDSGIPLDQYFAEFYDRFICEQNAILSQAGLIDAQPPLDPISETNYPTLWAWHTYCLENGISLSPPNTHSGGFKEFWDEHKKGIIIAAVVIVVAVTVAVIIVTTAGTGTSVAVASGAAAAQAAIDGYNASKDSDPNVQDLQHESAVNERIQNFAKAIGATDVNNTNGPVSVIEMTSISETTPEILTGLVTDWNKILLPVIETNAQSSLSIEPLSFFNDLSNEFSSLNKPAILPQQLSINQSQGSIDPFFYPSTNSPSPFEIDQRLDKFPWTEEEISTTKISEESTLLGKVKDLGSCAVHQLLDGAATLISIVPQALDELGNISAKILPESMPLTNFEGELVNPIKTYEGTVETLHEWIDKLFDLAPFSSPVLVRGSS